MTRVEGRRSRASAPPYAPHHPSPATRHSAYTLIEVLAALLLLAIIIPVALEALDTASLAGNVAALKGQAARVADYVLNQSIITTNWNFGTQTGTMNEGGRAFYWTLSSQSWPADSAMELLTTQVQFSVQGRNYSVQLSTLAPSTRLNSIMNPPQ
jgi:prepilin-type N-terminal cleavage/methylation domain-containing protein